MKTFIIAALSADGYIGQTSDQLTDWTSHEDKKLFVHLTKTAGVMVMGSRTFATIGRALPGRKTVVYSSRAASEFPEDVTVTSQAPAELLASLEKEGFNQAAICGGSEIYSQFLEAGLVDEIYLTVEPIIFGQGVPLFNHSLATKLELLEVDQLSHDVVMLHYRVLG